MTTLNYNHLRYFREVAHQGNLTRAAERLNISQSALSIQLKTLEERLGHALFDRVGRGLVLTEAGRIALDHADRIFSTGDELLSTLNRTGRARAPLRVGAQATLSRNFQLRFLGPVLGAQDHDVVLRSGNAPVLLDALKSLALDVVLTTEPPHSVFGSDFVTHRIAQQSVALHGVPARMDHPDLATLLGSEPLIVPTEPSIRSGLANLAEQLDVVPRIVAEVDDMAMVRLLAREDAGVALAPAVVVADEIASGQLCTAPYDLKIEESFHAVTVRRAFPHPVLRDLLPG